MRSIKLLEDDLDAAILRLAHTGRSRDQRAGVAEALDRNLVLRHAQADQLGRDVRPAPLRELWLYAAEPVRSAWPDTSIRVTATRVEACAASAMICRARSV